MKTPETKTDTTPTEVDKPALAAASSDTTSAEETPVVANSKAVKAVKAAYVDLFDGYTANPPTVSVTAGDDLAVVVRITGTRQAVKKAKTTPLALPEDSSLIIHQSRIGGIEGTGDASTITITQYILGL